MSEHPGRPTNERRRRVFFALWPDGEAAGHLEALGHALAPKGAKVVHGEKLHMTLAFIGAVDDAGVERLMEAADRVRAEPFELRLDRLGFWPQGGILYAGCRETPSRQRLLLQALGRELAAEGFAPDKRPYVPHVTLARRVRGLSLPRLETPVAWRAEEFALVESHLHPSAASYETLATWSLDA